MSEHFSLDMPLFLLSLGVCNMLSFGHNERVDHFKVLKRQHHTRRFYKFRKGG